MILGGLLVLEAALVVLTFQILLDFDCRDVTLYSACRALRLSLVQALCLLVGFGLYLSASPRARQTLVDCAADRTGAAAWAGLHLAGLVLIFAPLVLVPPFEFAARFSAILPVLVAGAALSATGALFWAARPGMLGRWSRAQGGVLPALVGAAILLPPVAEAAAQLWTWSPMAQGTFAAVARVLALVTDDLTVRPDEAIIGANGFVVAVASQCSGVEGLALTTAFLALYAVLFRDTLRQRRFWGVVFPLALATSWAFNVLRIAALILIGASGSRELALNGFHSFAGWLSFTALVLIVLSVAHTWRWLHRDVAPRSAAPGPPDAVERILPFVVFMIASVAVNALFLEPAAGYPAIAGALAVALWFARPAWRRLDWELSPLPILAGGAVGALWIATAVPPGDGTPWVATLGPAAQAGWIALRLIGTVLLVPVVEELFFRGYVQARVDDGRPIRRILAIALSVAPFAALHERWAIAAGAGLVFALVYLWRGRLADAILAHATANAVVAAMAAARGDWSLI